MSKLEGLTAAQREAIETLTDISDRADAMGIGLVKYPVRDVREVLATVRRLQMTSAGRTALEEER